MQIGYIGLGLMGGPLARNLIRAGYTVKVFDLQEESIQRTLAAGTTGSAVKSAAELADCDIVFTSLPLPRHILGTMIDGGLLDHMKKGSVYIDVSTIDPQTAEKLESYGAARGIGFLGCPQGKGPAQAEKAEQPIFAGGARDVFEKVKSVLAVIGKPVYYLGGARQAYAFKLISNMVGMTNLAVLAEGIRIAEAAGLDGEQFQSLLAETGANSAQLSMRGPTIRERDFHNKFGVDLALKDVRLGCEMAEGWDYDARFTRLAKEFFAKASEQGFGKEDCNAVYKVL